jgi:hypothetical protein
MARSKASAAGVTCRHGALQQPLGGCFIVQRQMVHGKAHQRLTLRGHLLHGMQFGAAPPAGVRTMQRGAARQIGHCSIDQVSR